MFVWCGKVAGESYIEKYIYRCPFDKLDRLANILGRHSDDPRHAMTLDVARSIMEEAREERRLAEIASQIGESTP